ncbi:UDP-N-acetylmuramoyl-L-alanine--D-glutamate ligase [Candidatus Vallotia lariciata]|uniref:UDP-N-acetylmuramoyl-L-alanine--D-glutamate ligase n=1 Tax=Candidatus Vallotia laricis TaxID=2018052 RepID=UPI001D02ED00|nr:UDP-N-acetylmuramoyl-L-alanine--D-glutamate ligase [Candidatus Vallotia lariciata]UDG82791.1 UDP-N-acetylmuramoylalanine--D-glutamate ligase [Candidatus Vallotia lariciata]
MFGEKFGERQRPATLVLGLGESGLAISRWCARHGCRLRVADTRATPPNLSRLVELGINAKFVSGVFSTELLDDGIELIGISPGLSLYSTDLAPLIRAARNRGIEVWGELEFFSQSLRVLAKNGYQPKILAITGTNGKTITTVLTGLLCERAGKSVAVAGNINQAILDKMTEALDSGKMPDVWVLELSSFQLESSYTFEPDAATILNITQDHLDWHKKFDTYATAKGRIFGQRTLRILNRDDTQVMAFVPSSSAITSYRTFGLKMPQSVGDYGIQHKKKIAWLVEACEPNNILEPRTQRLSNITEHAYEINKLIPVNSLRIRGLHNAVNAMAALALARSINLPVSALLHILREYRGEPHRVEWIRAIAGVDYVDDSKGTNVGATVAALEGLAQPIVLIAGGDGKGQNFTSLVPAVARYCRAVMLIGRDAPVLHTVLSNTGIPLALHLSLQSATRAAASVARPGDIVLLSPACASLDMFSGYVHRAQVFRSEIEDIVVEKEGVI